MSITLTLPKITTMLRAWKWGLLMGLLMAASALFWQTPTPVAAAGGNSITAPDTAVDVGRSTSLELDGSGNPVVSYNDESNGNLKVLHCNDLKCMGGGESISVVDAITVNGGFSSLELDGSGNPVVSYYNSTNDDLSVLHCNDANCTGGGEIITTPDTLNSVGEFTSLALDGAGNPVVSYYYSATSDLRVLHCNDPNCAPGGEIITTPDSGDTVGEFTSLALDGSGNPVVSYFDRTNTALKLLHCNDPDCMGGGESITTPDTGGSSSVGVYTSLVLDGSGNPVVSYMDDFNLDVKVLHCNDPNCDGVGEIITTPDTGAVGDSTSLVLDGGGNPVVTYYDRANTGLKVMHCNDANCAGAGESFITPDTANDVGIWGSLVLDGLDNPVVSYADRTNNDLKVLHCSDFNCIGLNPWLPWDVNGDGAVAVNDIVAVVQHFGQVKP